MSFRLVPTSVILNDLERRNGRYFAFFQRILVASGGAPRKSSRSLSHLLMSSCFLSFGAEGRMVMIVLITCRHAVGFFEFWGIGFKVLEIVVLLPLYICVTCVKMSPVTQMKLKSVSYYSCISIMYL